LAGPSIRGASPRGTDSAGTTGVSTSVPTVAILLLLGLALRFIIAYVLLPGSGFPNDLASFAGWSGQLVSNTPLGFYEKAGFVDYPPVYLLFLWLVGLALSPFTSGIGEGIKLIPIFMDLVLATIVYAMARDMGASQRRSLAAMTVVLLNPITWFNSAIWGQADTVGAVFMLLGLWALLHDRRELASALAVVAALTKMQLGILGLLVGLVVLRRSLFPRDGRFEPERVLTSIAAGLGAGALVCLPFSGLDFLGLGPRLGNPEGMLTFAAGVVTGAGVLVALRLSDRIPEAYRPLISMAGAVGTAVLFAAMRFGAIADHIAQTFGEYPFLTLNAYNPWALVGDQAGNAMDTTGAWIHDAPYTDQGVSYAGFAFGPFSGMALLALACLIALLVAVAAVAWLRAGAADMDAELYDSDDGSDGPAAATAGVAEEAGPRPDGAGSWLGSELRAVAIACLAGAAAVVLLLAGQATNGLPAAVVGDVFLLVSAAAVALWAAWRDDRLSLVVALTILAIAFFVAPTRVHERYLFPFFAVGALLLALSWRWTAVYVALSVVNSANLLAVIVQYSDLTRNTGIPINDGALASLLIDWGKFLRAAVFPADWDSPLTPAGVVWPIALAGAVTGLAFLWALLQMRPRAVHQLATEAAGAGGEEAGGWQAGETEVVGGTPVPALGVPAAQLAEPLPAHASGPASGAGGPELAGGQADETWSAEMSDAEEWEEGGEEAWPEGEAEEPEFVPRWAMSAWHWLSRSPSMPDRSASLAKEGHGRLDKLDLWVVVAIAIVVLSMRIWRLDEPRQMYFDEVYHARTATEFLQEWQYGIRHDIYEWTHPHFAKYAIAGGLTVFADDRVTATANLGVPIKDAVVQPRITPPNPSGSGAPDARTDPNARLGDRLFVATGSQVRAYDLETRALEASYDVAGAISMSLAGDTGYLYVGTSDGRIWRIDTLSLDYVRLGTQQTPKPPAMLAATLDFPIVKLYAGSPPLILALDGTGNIVSLDGTGKVVGQGFVDGAADFAPLDAGPVALVRKAATASSGASVTPPATPVPTRTANPTASPSEGATPEPTPGALPSELEAEAEAIAGALNMDVASIEALIGSATAPALEQPLDVGSLSDEQVTALQNLIDGGQLPDFDLVRNDPQVAVAFGGGVALMDVRFLTLSSTVPTDAPATSIAVNPDQGQESYVAAGSSIVLIKINQSGGSITLAPDQPLQRMPGPVTAVVFDAANKVAQALGRTPDGSGWTVYAIESNGNAVFSDAKLPWQPLTIGLDSTPDLPQTDHQALLAFNADGSIASVDVGQFAFAWRIVGVFFGALMAVCMYLLARILFRRRAIGLLLALFTCIDGMFFVQSRIAMNDTYVGGLLLLGYVLFALLWLGEKTSRRAWVAFWLGMPLLGLIMGLALFTKWVALYAIASMGILILIRSALGRLITIVGLAAGTGTLGWLAIDEMKTLPGTGNVPVLILLLATAGAAIVVAAYLAQKRARTTPDKVLFVGVGIAVAIAIAALAMTYYPGADQNGSPNYTYFLIMFAATAIAAAANAYHPIAWTKQEFWFSVIAPGVIGVVLAGVLAAFKLPGVLTMEWSRIFLIAIAGIAAGPVFGLLFLLAGHWGFGPLAMPPAADDPSVYAEPPAPAPQGWLRLGNGFGLPAAWMGACLLVLPLIVYIAGYIPWSMPWQPQGPDTGSLPVIMCWHYDANGTCTDAFPRGHTGQTLMDLTESMYNYHNDLRATHAASSPWWAWPMDLKPVWFESVSYGQDTGSMIYDGGNPLLWWLAIAAMGFVCWQAFKRRSLALALIAIAFFWQWISWSRIDRAAFQYHFYTALPFFLMGLAYLLAELWHGPSRRTWLMARVALAGAIVFAPVLWLLKYQLCGLARVNTDDYWGKLVCGVTAGHFVLDQRIALIMGILVVALIWLGIALYRLERNAPEPGEEGWSWALQLVVPVVVAGAVLLVVGAIVPAAPLIDAQLPSDPVAMMVLVFLGVVAFGALSMRRTRRFVTAVYVAAVIMFAVLYPNLSALPMPQNIVSAYNGFLPTWLYGFQFSVNLQPSLGVPLLSFNTMSVAAAVLIFGAVPAAYVAWIRRVVNGYNRHLLIAGRGHGPDPGGAGAAPPEA
jgi:dolichyl-phosphate-mannose--protein O-mannosyl transferase